MSLRTYQQMATTTTKSANSAFISMFTLTAVVMFGGIAAIGFGTSLARHNVGDTHKSACQVQQDKYEASLGADGKNIVGECK